MIEKATHLTKDDVDHINCGETGSTMVMAAINGNTLTMAHLGDSRGY